MVLPPQRRCPSERGMLTVSDFVSPVAPISVVAKTYAFETTFQFHLASGRSRVGAQRRPRSREGRRGPSQRRGSRRRSAPSTTVRSTMSVAAALAASAPLARGCSSSTGSTSHSTSNRASSACRRLPRHACATNGCRSRGQLASGQQRARHLVALIFGSYSRLPFRHQLGAFMRSGHCYGDRVAFVVV
jgi:hypothetical protein